MIWDVLRFARFMYEAARKKPHTYYQIYLFVGYCYKPIMELTEPGNDTKSRLREVTVVKLLDTEASSFR